MTTARNWFDGARPKTLGASVAPVLVGTAAAAQYGDVIYVRALGALVVSVALQVGVNYANDYADGVRGIDRVRAGPIRLTASGLAAPAAVKRAALVAFGLASLVGIALGLVVDWRLIAVGATCVLAGLLYSGGPKPYASAGLGEAFVFVFFGLVATCGSAFVHLERVPWLAVPAAVAVGLGAVAILLVNNLRDIASDSDAGKRTLSVRIGATNTRRLYRACLAGMVAVGGLTALEIGPWIVPALITSVLGYRLVVAVSRPEATPPELVKALIGTARFQFLFSALLALGLWRG